MEQIDIPVSYVVRVTVMRLRYEEDMSESDEWTGFANGITGVSASGKTKDEVIFKLTELINIRCAMDAGMDFIKAVDSYSTTLP